MIAYYNEIDPYAAQWLRNLITAGLIAPGDVDARPIQEVQPDEVSKYTQCHFFAGIAGWSLAARLAGWADDRPLWTGSCPCQPFSVAGRGKGIEDARHLWPHFYRLIRGSRPPVVMGEQVAGAAGYAWLDGVLTDLEAEAYAGRAVDIPACSVNAPQIRNRLYWVACAESEPKREPEHAQLSLSRKDAWFNAGGSGRRFGANGRMGGPGSERLYGEQVRVFARGSQQASAETAGPSCGAERVENSMQYGRGARGTSMPKRESGATLADHRGGAGGFWDDWQLIGPDPEGKYRRIKPGIAPLDTRLPGDVGQIRGYGNAICPEVAAEVIRAYMECAA